MQEQAAFDRCLSRCLGHCQKGLGSYDNEGSKKACGEDNREFQALAKSLASYSSQ